METDILKYIEDGISIDGNITKGYEVFTIKTQHFKISSLNELNPERFEKAIDDFKERTKLENELLSHSGLIDMTNIDLQGYVDGKYDDINKQEMDLYEEWED